MTTVLQVILDAFKAQKEMHDRTRIVGGLLSTIARKLPVDFYTSPMSRVEPLEPLDSTPTSPKRFSSAANAKKWVFDSFDDFVWVGIDGSQLAPVGVTRSGLAAQTGICVYGFIGLNDSKRNCNKEWNVTRPIMTPRPGFFYPDVEYERYLQEIEHARCIISILSDGKPPCDDCQVKFDGCPNQEVDLSPLTGKQKIMVMLDFPLEPSWMEGISWKRREQFIQAHERILELRDKVLLVGITHGSMAKDYVRTVIDHFDDALWEKIGPSGMRDLINTIQSWKKQYPIEAEALVKEWAQRNKKTLKGTPLAYLSAILESPDVRRLITDFDGLGSYFESSGDRSLAFKCKRKLMQKFGYGFVTGYYFMPWGGFSKNGEVVKADDWIRVGFGIKPGLGENNNVELMDSLHNGILAQIIIGHGTPFVLARAHLLAAYSKRRLIQLMLRAVGALPTYKTLRKVKPV